MPLADDDILGQNPWWSDPSWESGDPQLGRLALMPMVLPAGFAESVDLTEPGVHVLRGPRQVGKSTGLKLAIRRAFAEGVSPRRVIYLTFDLMEGAHHAELAGAVKRAKQLVSPPGSDPDSLPALILLDEVTAVPRWQTAIKAVWDDGTISRDVVICTGSSAIDLQRGSAERLPGRRGGGVDHLILPQSFAEFARAVEPTIPASPRLNVEELAGEQSADVLREARLHLPKLQQAMERYLVFGGFPAAIVDAISGEPVPRQATKNVLADSLVREMQRFGASVTATYALLERVKASLGSTTNWSRLARVMDVPLGRSGQSPSHQTLRSYIELLAGGYFLFIAYYWRSGSSTNALSSDKKLFFADPLLHTITLDNLDGAQPDLPALVENAVGLALLRRYEPPTRLIESFVSPERLHIWRTGTGGEVDFAAGPRSRLDLVEVKYRRDIDRRTVAGIPQTLQGRPVLVATRDRLERGRDLTFVPAAILLWALG